MRRDAALLLDMVGAALDVETTLGGRDLPAFEASRVTQLAAQMSLVIIGEAAGRLSRQFTIAHPEIEWPQIVAFRNVLVHGYHQVNLRRVFEIATVEVPKLATWLETVAPSRP